MNGMISYNAPNDLPIPVGDNSGAKAIAHWLGIDIQYTVASLDRWLSTLSDVVNGKANEGYQGTGNSFSVFASKKVMMLESEHIDSHKVCLTFEQLSDAMENYRVFLESDFRSSGFTPTPFEVEYLAEESAANDAYAEKGGVYNG